MQVTIRIDQIKELKLPDIQSAFAQGESWLLCRKNDNEALVERHSLEGMAEQAANGVVSSVLKFWRLDKESGSRSSRALSKARSGKSGVVSNISAPSESAFSEGSVDGEEHKVAAEELQKRLSMQAA